MPRGPGAGLSAECTDEEDTVPAQGRSLKEQCLPRESDGKIFNGASQKV